MGVPTALLMFLKKKLVSSSVLVVNSNIDMGSQFRVENQPPPVNPGDSVNLQVMNQTVQQIKFSRVETV